MGDFRDAIVILAAGVAASLLLRGHAGPSLTEALLLASLGVGTCRAVRVGRAGPAHTERLPRRPAGLLIEAGVPGALAAFALLTPESALPWVGAWLIGAAAAYVLLLRGSRRMLRPSAKPRKKVVIIGATDAQSIIQAIQWLRSVEA